MRSVAEVHNPQHRHIALRRRRIAADCCVEPAAPKRRLAFLVRAYENTIIFEHVDC
jgi:hypothetical protein